MRPVLVTQRVEEVRAYGERRDALDQRWPQFLAACGRLAVPVPNRSALAIGLADRVAPAGLLLTGGNDLMACGGNAPERDETERVLLEWARDRGVPVFGVCRGLQFLLHSFGVALEPVSGHVGTRHMVRSGHAEFEVNSFHKWGARGLGAEFEALATCDGGWIEAVRHRHLPIAGVMWHPEREPRPVPRDIALIRDFLSTGQAELAA